MQSRMFRISDAFTIVGPVWRTYDTGPRGPGSKLACVNWFFSQARKLVDTAWWSSSLEMLVEPSPHQSSPKGRAPVHSTNGSSYQGSTFRAGSKSKKSQGVGRCAPAITRLIAYASNFPFSPFMIIVFIQPLSATSPANRQVSAVGGAPTLVQRGNHVVCLRL